MLYLITLSHIYEVSSAVEAVLGTFLINEIQYLAHTSRARRGGFEIIVSVCG